MGATLILCASLIDIQKHLKPLLISHNNVKYVSITFSIFNTKCPQHHPPKSCALLSFIRMLLLVRSFQFLHNPKTCFDHFGVSHKVHSNSSHVKERAKL